MARQLVLDRVPGEGFKIDFLKNGAPCEESAPYIFLSFQRKESPRPRTPNNFLDPRKEKKKIRRNAIEERGQRKYSSSRKTSDRGGVSN